jgi:uncharacterized membrane protein YbhN (UPF0104 family)/tRNA A-37 threonylcarbamoyl transferase component Bud32
MVGLFSRLWQALRLKGFDRRGVISLRQAVERAALLSYSAQGAGVGTPRLVGMGERADSMMLVMEHPDGFVSLSDMDQNEVTDEILQEIWRQLRKAHKAGLAHRNLTEDVVLVKPTQYGRPDVMLTRWDYGDVASSELARRIDSAHLLAALAVVVGAPRAMASAAEALGSDELISVAPLLQVMVLPNTTRERAEDVKAVMKQLRAELVDIIPLAEDVEPAQLRRFGWRTVAMLTFTVIAIWVVFTKIQFAQIVDAVTNANPWWILAAFALGLSTFVGAALAMIGFSPVKLPVWRTILVQVATSAIILVAPSVVGPTMMNLRFLLKRKMSRPLAVASVSLAQSTLVITTAVLLLVIALVTGDMGALSAVPTSAVVGVLALVVVLAASVLLLPRLREWIWKRIGPTWIQVRPRIVWVLGQPHRLIIGLGGNFLLTFGYVLAVWCSLRAFGITDVSLTTAALVYLLGNTAGYAVPTPGGLGTVELAISAGLTSLGVAVGAAASAAVLFRTVTYWARLPLGWLALRYLNAHEEI